MKFSIGIPAFKSSYLAECIESILSQTENDFELIIVNDCSPQPIKEVVRSFSDSRIQYFENEINIGAENVVDNWNKCLSKASGDYFILMGDDDKMMPNYLEEILVLINKYPDLDVFHCRSCVINSEGEPQKYTVSWPEYESVYENIWHRITELRTQYISDFVYRRETLVKNGGYFKLPLAWSSDDISSYIAAGSKGIAHTNIPLFCYRESSQTISSTGNRELKMSAILNEGEWLNNFLIHEPNGEIDKILRNVILKSLNKYLQKKKIRTISRSFFDNNVISGFLQWLPLRNKYKFSTVELIYSYVEYLKMSRAKAKY